MSVRVYIGGRAIPVHTRKPGISHETTPLSVQHDRANDAVADTEPDAAAPAWSLREIGFYSTVELFSMFTANGPMLRPWVEDAQINRDRNLRLQYLAGPALEQPPTACYPDSNSLPVPDDCRRQRQWQIAHRAQRQRRTRSMSPTIARSS